MKYVHFVDYPELTISSLGFEVSEARRSLVSTLSSSGFFWREFLLTPTQIGVPNSRLRYYLIARKRDFPSYDDPFEHLPKGEIIEQFPGAEKGDVECETLGSYLETGDHLDEYLIGADVLKKRAEVADIVTAEGFKSCCFTKSYGRYVEGTGEVVHKMTCKTQLKRTQAGSGRTLKDQKELKSPNPERRIK